MFIKNRVKICVFGPGITTFIKSKSVMVSKEELRKLDKEELVDLVYDLLIKVDALTRMVEALQE